MPVHGLVILCHNCERIYLRNCHQLNSTYPCWQSPWNGDDECGVYTKLFFTLSTHLQQCVNGSMTVGCGLLLMPVHLNWRWIRWSQKMAILLHQVLFAKPFLVSDLTNPNTFTNIIQTNIKREKEVLGRWMSHCNSCQ